MQIYRFAIIFSLIAGALVLAPSSPAQSSHTVTAATVDQWMKELSNWNRWGADDQMGAVNLITPAKRKAASLVKDGECLLHGPYAEFQPKPRQ